MIGAIADRLTDKRLRNLYLAHPERAALLLDPVTPAADRPTGLVPPSERPTRRTRPPRRGEKHRAAY